MDFRGRLLFVELNIRLGVKDSRVDCSKDSWVDFPKGEFS